MKIRSKLICFFIAICIAIVPVQAYAAGKVKDLVQGEPAPFAGILYDYELTAQILADKEMAKVRCELETKYAVNMCEAESTFKINSLTIQLDVAEKKFQEIIKIKDEEINKLRSEIADGSGKYTYWWFAGGVVLGAIAAIAIVYAVR